MNIFRKADLKIVFHTNSTIRNLPTQENQPPDKFSLLGVYKLTCPTCNKAYVVQKGKCFTIHYNEHKQAFRNNSHTSRFAQHLNEKGHSFDTINNIMQVLHFQKEGTHLNTIERFHIHTEYTANNNLNNNHTLFHNAIFDTLLKTHQPQNPPLPILLRAVIP